MDCNLCKETFNPDEEGGVTGMAGIVPLNLCPWCLSSVQDLTDQLRVTDDDTPEIREALKRGWKEGYDQAVLDSRAMERISKNPYEETL